MDTDKLDDLTLQAAANGLVQAHASLLAKARRYLEQYLASQSVRRGLSSEDLEDVLAETLELAWQRFHMYDPQKRNFTAWLAAIAKKTISNRVRLLTSPAKRTETDPMPGIDPEPSRKKTDRKNATTPGSTQPTAGAAQKSEENDDLLASLHPISYQCQSDASSPDPQWDASIQKQGWEAFSRDLHELLRTHPEKCVAYRGPERIGIADHDADLYEDCLRRGIPVDELYVARIRPTTNAPIFLPPLPLRDPHKEPRPLGEIWGDLFDEGDLS